LQKVAPSLKSAQGFLAQAAGHLDSAQSVSETDPTGAYSLLYDAARTSLAAVLHARACERRARAATTRSQEAIKRYNADHGSTTSKPTAPSSAPCTLWPSSWSTCFPVFTD
jgi:hypothetical protein